MFYSKDILASQVIQDYLHGKTRNQIANDNSTSTGNVSSITKEWKQRKYGNLWYWLKSQVFR